jgi:glycosyltransferase involved in cell wall biosynthesis
MDISVILPIYNEREAIGPLLEEIEQAMRPTGLEFEVIAVDDGSTDGSDLLIRQLAGQKSWLKAVLFRQNHGQSACFDAGFRNSVGRLIVTMDADGQNDPADIPKMIEHVDHGGYDCALGHRVNRKDGWLFRKLPSRIANLLIRKVTRTSLHDLGCSLKVYRHEITDELRLYGEMHRFIGVLVEGMGARIVEVPVNHRPRRAGKSKYGITRTFKVLLDLVTVWFMRGYQTNPIYVFGGSGLLLGFIGVILSAYVLYEKIAKDIYVHRNPLFILSMIFSVMAVQFLVLGLLAEIMVRTYFESQHKPTYLIAEKVNFDAMMTGGSPLVVSLSPKLRSGTFGTSAKGSA